MGDIMSKKWKKLLDEDDLEFLRERAEGGFLEPLDEVDPTDEDIIEAFDADWRDALHNANMPWDEDFRELWEKWYVLLTDKLGYNIDFVIKVRGKIIK